jgi:hypothetical protein
MIFYLLLGVLIGVVVTLICTRTKTYGTVIVYLPEDVGEPLYMGFKLNENTINICSKKQVKLNVDVQRLNSQN